MTQRLLLAIAIPTDWARIDPIREAVGHALMAVYGSAELKDALSMVSAELLENAMKYGQPDARGVRLLVHERAGQIAIEVTNTVEPSTRHVAALGERLAWIASFPTPAEAYVAALAKLYEAGETARGVSQLGLVRIAYEGECSLEKDATEDEVTVRALREVPGRRAGAEEPRR